MSAPARAALVAAMLSAPLDASAQGVAAEAGRVSVEVSPPDAQVIVDDRVVGRGSQALALPPGPHRVRVRARDYTVEERTVSIAAGDSQVVRVELRPFRASPWPWIVLGAGAAATVVLVVGVLAATPYNASFDRPIRVRFDAP